MHHERILDVGPLGLHAVVLVGSSSGKLPTFSESVVVKARHPQLALSALGGIGALLPLLLPPVPSRSAISYVLRGQHVFRALVLLVVASLQGGRGASQNLAWFRHYGGPRMLATVLRSCRPRYLERGLLETLLAAVAAVGGKARFQTFARFVDAHAEREVSSLCHDDDDQSTVRGFLCSIRSTFSYLVAVDSLTHQQGDQKGDREAEENEDDQFSPIEFPNQYDGTEQKSSDKPPVSSKVWRERGTLCEEIMNELIFAPRIWMRASFAVQCRLWEALRSRCRVGHPDRALLRQHGHGVQRLMEILRDYYRVPPAGFDDKRKTTITVFYSPLASRASASSLSPPFSSPASSSSSFSSSSSSPSSSSTTSTSSSSANKETEREVVTQRTLLTRDEILTLRGLLLECVMALMEDFSLSQASSSGMRVLQRELDAIHGLIHNELARTTLEKERKGQAMASPSKHGRKHSRKISEEVRKQKKDNLNRSRLKCSLSSLFPPIDRVCRRRL